MSKYWENETPVTITTGRNVLQYFKDAGKLSVTRPVWIDDKGVERRGKVVVLDVTALLEADTEDIKTARDIFSSLSERLNRRLTLLRD